MEGFNANIIFTKAYFIIGANAKAPPKFVEGQIVGMPPNDWAVQFHLHTSDLTAKRLKKLCPFLWSTLKDSAADAVIQDQLQTDLRTGVVQRGYYLQEEGRYVSQMAACVFCEEQSLFQSGAILHMRFPLIFRKSSWSNRLYQLQQTRYSHAC